MVAELKDAFRQRRWLRTLTVLAVVYLLLRVAIALFWVTGMLEIEGWPADSDLRVYLDAGNDFWNKSDLYYKPLATFAVYVYSPAYAMVFGALTPIPYNILVCIDIILHLLVYALLYARWFAIFRRYHLDAAADQMIRLLPVWLIFSSLMSDTTYLNVYVFMAFLATLLIEAVLEERLGVALLLIAIILPIKPHWAFALGIPLFAGQWRFLAKLVLGSLLIYAAEVGITVLIGGSYAWNQYGAYIDQLRSIPSSFPWNMISSEGHFGYNHSIMQVVIYFTEDSTSALLISSLIKVLLITPLIGLAWRHRSNTVETKLETAFALYFAAFLWVDVISELIFSIVIFAYLRSIFPRRRWLNLVFLSFALTDMWGFLTAIITFFVTPPPFIVYPDLYIPFMLIVMLVFYGVLLKRLWQPQNVPQASPEVMVPVAQDL